MSYSDYVQAAKIGKKDYQSKLMAGESPTLEVLDDILHTTKSYREVSLGLVQIPISPGGRYQNCRKKQFFFQQLYAYSRP